MQNRREFCQSGALICGCLLLSLSCLAADAKDQKAALEARSTTAALTALGVPATTEPGRQILLDVPDIVQSGTNVPIRVMSAVPGTDWIAVLVDRNPFPFVGQFEIPARAKPEVELDAKLAQTSAVRAVVRAGGKYYVVTKEVKVTIGDCR